LSALAHCSRVSLCVASLLVLSKRQKDRKQYKIRLQNVSLEVFNVCINNRALVYALFETAQAERRGLSPALGFWFAINREWIYGWEYFNFIRFFLPCQSLFLYSLQMNQIASRPLCLICNEFFFRLFSLRGLQGFVLSF